MTPASQQLTEAGRNAELMLRRPWFQAQTPQGLHSAPTEIGTLREIFGALGTPTPEAWPDADTLPNYMRFSACPGQPLRATFTQVGRGAWRVQL